MLIRDDKIELPISGYSVRSRGLVGGQNGGHDTFSGDLGSNTSELSGWTSMETVVRS